MRIQTLLLLATFSVALIEAKFKYDGLVLTSIDVTTAPIENRPNRVEFPGGVADGTDSDDTAVFLKNVKEARRENGKLILEGDVVDIKAVEHELKKPLFCIHGFNVSAVEHMASCQKALETAEDEGPEKNYFQPIPVIWPALGDSNFLANYLSKRETESVGAGKAFKTLTKYMGVFPKKSLHAHSMGNRVLRYAADAGFTFDNIFMVAAVSNVVLLPVCF